MKLKVFRCRLVDLVGVSPESGRWPSDLKASAWLCCQRTCWESCSARLEARSICGAIDEETTYWWPFWRMSLSVPQLSDQPGLFFNKGMLSDFVFLPISQDSSSFVIPTRSILKYCTTEAVLMSVHQFTPFWGHRRLSSLVPVHD